MIRNRAFSVLLYSPHVGSPSDLFFIASLLIKAGSHINKKTKTMIIHAFHKPILKAGTNDISPPPLTLPQKGFPDDAAESHGLVRKIML
jgi:hypothetical protein